jgi:hypothetical protein
MTAAVLLSSLLISAWGAAVHAAQGPVLRLVWTDPQGLGRTLEPLVTVELARALHEAGVGIHWTSWDGAARDVHEGEIRIVVSDRPTGSTPPHALGAARVDGASRWVTAYLGNARRTLRLDPRPGTPLDPRARHLLAHAVTRIVLHELVHAGRPERPHAEAGLMAPSVGRRHLVAPRPPLDAEVRAALRAAAEAPPAAAKALAAAVVDEAGRVP